MDYTLLPDEALILKNESASCTYGKKRYNGELTLTNRNLNFICNGAFGKIKYSKQIPLNQIKMYNSKPQAILGKSRGGSAQMEVYTISGEALFFSFNNSFTKKELLKWIDSICEILTGEKADLDASERATIPGMDILADSLKGTFDTFKKSFGVPEKQAAANFVSCKCISCMAPINGKKGTLVKCRYCDTEQKI